MTSVERRASRGVSRGMGLLAVIGLWASGCAQTALVHRWQPPTVDPAGMQRLAVVDFSGDRGEAVTAALESRLWRNGVPAVVARSGLDAVIPAAGRAGLDDELLLQAQRTGLDGLIVGTVLEYRCDDCPSDAAPFEARSGGGRAPQTSGPARSLGTVRDAAVEIEFRLIDACTGEAVLERRIARRRQVRCDSRHPPFDGRAELLEQLRDECLDEFVALLAPTRVEEGVTLAPANWLQRGAADVHRGNRLAREAAWEPAEAAWRAALQKHPDNDSALFNLAIASAQRQDYAAAEDFAMRALRLAHSECYTAGLEQIRRFRADFEKIERQRQGRVLPAAHTAWR